MADSDVTIEILKDIRSEIRTTNQRLATVEEQLGGVQAQLGSVQSQLGVAGTALLDLAEQQRFVVRYAKALAERDVHLEGRVSSLESRVDKLESR